jgi:hypothetical protein
LNSKVVSMPAIALSEDQKKAAVAIGRSYWASAFKAQFPNATKEEKDASWKQSRKDYVKLGKAAVRQLSKSGFSISKNPD